MDQNSVQLKLDHFTRGYLSKIETEKGTHNLTDHEQTSLCLGYTLVFDYGWKIPLVAGDLPLEIAWIFSHV